ncbi:hypothetical protein TA3x_005084 [Tundrisphaera sp. TA3]|uniref:hypothetical protein n=1 Tax=Tundrisphaera sp. TA3 TaxID=3435775 RepID=UPI003EB91D6B
MTRRMSALAALVALSLVPGIAHAGRGQYNRTPAMGPDGPIFNPAMTPEYRQARGSPEVYQQLMQQKLMIQQQKEAMAYQKQMAAYLKSHPEAREQLEAQQEQAERMARREQQILWGRAPSRKKKPATGKAAASEATAPSVAGAPTTPNPPRSRSAKPPGAANGK